MIEPTVEIAIIGGLTVLCTGIFSHLQGRQATKRQRDDWRRQDEVAARAAETATLLLKTQKDGIRRTDEVARAAAIATDETHSQLRQIHAFVNSDLTKVLQADLDQTKVTLVVLRKLIDGRDYRPTAEDSALIKTTEARIAELEVILSRRPGQLREVEAEIKAAINTRERQRNEPF